MSRTDGMLLAKIEGINDEKINDYCFIGLLVWILSPIVMTILNLTNVKTYTFHGILTIALYVSGCIGLLFGLLYLVRFIKNERDNKDALILSLQPVWALIILGIWCAFCTLFAEEKRVAIYGYESLKDNLFTFLFFGGLFLSAFTFGNNKKKLIKLARVFSLVSVIVSMVSICIDKSALINGSSITNAAGNEASYMGEYLILAILVSIILAMNFSSRFDILFFLSIPIITLELLINNDVLSILILLVITISLLCFAIIKFSKEFKVKTILSCVLILITMVLFIVLKEDVTLRLYGENILETLNGRALKWKSAFNFILSAPVVGVGPQNTMDSANSFLLQMAMYIGVPGLIMFLFICITVLSKRTILISKIAPLLLVFLLSISLSDTTYYIAAYLFVLLGIAAFEYKNCILKDAAN